MRPIAHVVPALALLLGACTAMTDEPTDEPTDDVDDVEGKADGAVFPAGAFVHNGAAGDELAELILMPDHTFIRVASLEYDSIRTRGTYRFTRWEDRTYIRFYGTRGDFVDRYRYYMNGSVLKLRPNPTSAQTGTYEPMFTEATGKDAWTLGVRLDWFDNWFDIDVDTWSHTPIGANELPAAAMPAYTDLTQNGATDVDVFKFTSHGGRGFDAYAFDTVMLFDESGALIATGDHSDDFFEFAWE